MTEIIEKDDFVVGLQSVKNLGVPFGTADIIEGNIYFVRDTVDCSCGRYLDIGLFTTKEKNITICCRKIHYESEDAKKLFTLDVEKNTITPTEYSKNNWKISQKFLQREKVLLSEGKVDIYSPIVYAFSEYFKKVDISQESRDRKINIINENL